MNGWSFSALIYAGKSTPSSDRNFFTTATSPVSSADTSNTFNPCPAYLCATRTSPGNSSRHGPHHVAHMFTNTALPPESCTARKTSTDVTGVTLTFSTGTLFVRAQDVSRTPSPSRTPIAHDRRQCPNLEAHASAWPQFTNGRDKARPSELQFRRAAIMLASVHQIGCRASRVCVVFAAR